MSYQYDCHLERLPYGERLTIGPVWREENDFFPQLVVKRSWWQQIIQFTRRVFQATYE